MEPSDQTFFAINHLHDSLEQGGIESWRGWRIFFDAIRQFFKTMQLEGLIPCIPYRKSAQIIAVPH